MSYHLKSKPRNEIKGRIIVAICFFIFVFIFINLFSESSRSFFHTISRPIWVSESIVFAPIRGTLNFFKFKNSLIKENLDLKDELSALKLKEIDYDILLKENQELKSEIGRRVNKNLVFSRVLSRPPKSPYDTFVIDIGSTHGVSLADKVYLSDNVIVGVVTAVTPQTSLVKLFSSESNKQEAVLSRTGTSFVLEGRGGANFHIEVPKDTDILWGDIFLYPGINSSVIGSVYYIDSNSQSSFKTVYVRFPGNVFQTKSLFVETLR